MTKIYKISPKLLYNNWSHIFNLLFLLYLFGIMVRFYNIYCAPPCPTVFYLRLFTTSNNDYFDVYWVFRNYAALSSDV